MAKGAASQTTTVTTQAELGAALAAGFLPVLVGHGAFVVADNVCHCH
jgi:hypothetical protein